MLFLVGKVLGGALDFHGGNIRAAVEKYQLSGRSVVDFSASINPLGLPRNLKNVLSRGFETILHYPDPECRIIRENLSRYLKIPTENILAGNGSIELIFLLSQALKPKKALIFIPTFSEYERAVKLAGGECVFLEADGSSYSASKILRCLNRFHRGDLVFICNPNNPTGSLIEKKAMQSLVAECGKRGIFLAVDEVFMDFVEEKDSHSLLKAVPRNRHLLVLGSLTKFFSLAGLRLGFLAGEKSIIKKISSYQAPWSVNSLAQLAGTFVLKDAHFIKQSREYLFRQRNILFNGLNKIKGIEPYPSNGNFIFCKILSKRTNSRRLRDDCGKKGLLIRDCSDFRGLNDRFFRVAVRKSSENRKLIETLRYFFKL